VDALGHAELRQRPAQPNHGHGTWRRAGKVQERKNRHGIQGQLAIGNWQLANHGEHVKDFRELQVWEKAHQMALRSYHLTEGFPKHELFGMASQIRRCSVSIPANIAEGCGRLGNMELHRFLQIACGSASELEYHLLLARDLGYLSASDYLSTHKQLLEMKRMLVALTRKVGSDRRIK
jgi:four helix bundle protein